MRTWNRQKSQERIREAVASVQKLRVYETDELPDLADLGVEDAALLNATHVYVEFTNAAALLRPGGAHESEATHRRFLRFVHQYERVVHLALSASGIEKVHYQNSRLHAVVCDPSGDGRQRVAKAVQLADTIVKTVVGANPTHHELPNAVLSVGIEDGRALVVANGTRGDRELLFLGRPANYAAKLLGPPGIYLGKAAAGLLGVTESRVEEWTVRLARAIVDLRLDPEALIRKWHEELGSNPLARFEFKPPPDPLSKIDFEKLGPPNTLRGEMVNLFVDIDGFTAFVDECLSTGKAKDAAQALHVARKELRDVVKDFEGRKVQYHGDCMHAVVGERSDGEVDAEASAVTAGLCIGALLDAFDDIKAALPVARKLGIAIGAEAGPTSLTRLGVDRNRDRCAAGRAVLVSEEVQCGCAGGEAKLGEVLTSWAPDSLKRAFTSGKRLSYTSVAAYLQAAEHSAASAIGYGSAAFPQTRIERAYADES